MCNTRICTKCKIEKELTNEFYVKNCKNKLGFATMCKECRKQYKLTLAKNQERYQKTIKSNPNYFKEQHHKHKHKHIDRGLAYREKNKDKRKQYMKLYREKNKSILYNIKTLYRKKQRDLLVDTYIIEVIITNASRIGIKLTRKDITTEMIEIQRKTIQLNREYKINNFLK